MTVLSIMIIKLWNSEVNPVFWLALGEGINRADDKPQFVSVRCHHSTHFYLIWRKYIKFQFEV